LSLLILLAIPSLSVLVSIVAVITVQTLYLRLQGRPCRVIPFPGPLDRLARRQRSRVPV
jgi:hypothetical protein